MLVTLVFKGDSEDVLMFLARTSNSWSFNDHPFHIKDDLGIKRSEFIANLHAAMNNDMAEEDRELIESDPLYLELFEEIAYRMYLKDPQIVVGTTFIFDRQKIF